MAPGMAWGHPDDRRDIVRRNGGYLGGRALGGSPDNVFFEVDSVMLTAGFPRSSTIQRRGIK